MTQKSSGGGWSLRKALVRRIAQAVNEYDKELNRPAPGAGKPAQAPASSPPAAPPAPTPPPEGQSGTVEHSEGAGS